MMLLLLLLLQDVVAVVVVDIEMDSLCSHCADHECRK